MLNFDFKAAKPRRMLQINDLDELKLEGYESSKICKERTNHWHEKHIMKKQSEEGAIVFYYFNSKLRLFSDKLKSQWLRPF